MSQPLTVRTLMGVGSFESSVTCLRSVVNGSQEPLRLIVHEDGTLTPGHRDRLRAEVDPHLEFVLRDDADEAVVPLLARYPSCLDYRQRAPLALKLFDTVLLNDGPLVFVDSDIFFRKTVAGLFDPARVGRPTFMDNGTHSYAIRPWRAWPADPMRLAGRINSGLIVGWTASIDLDFAEWVLNRLARDVVFRTRPYWVEQTCWAALAGRTETRLFDPRQVAMATATMSEVTPEAVAIHFVSTFRGSLANYQDQTPQPGNPAVAVRTIPNRRVAAWDLFWSDLRRPRR